MRQLLIMAVLLLSATYANTQIIGATNGLGVNGVNDAMIRAQDFSAMKFAKVTSGTPFFMEQFMNARLKDDKGGTYSSHAVRLNLIDNQVNFLDANGTEMIAVSPINQVFLTDTTTGIKYTFVLGKLIPAVDQDLAGTWFEVLVNDTISLCKQMKKTIHETPAYGHSTTEQNITTANAYFIQLKGKFIRLDSWSALIQLFSDKKDAINQFVHDHHLKGKSDEDYAQLVQYYNTLNKA